MNFHFSLYIVYLFLILSFSGIREELHRYGLAMDQVAALRSSQQIAQLMLLESAREIFSAVEAIVILAGPQAGPLIASRRALPELVAFLARLNFRLTESAGNASPSSESVVALLHQIPRSLVIEHAPGLLEFYADFFADDNLDDSTTGPAP